MRQRRVIVIPRRTGYGMYQKFYGLRDKPFNITPDTEYLYLGNYHREALDSLAASIKKKDSLFLLTGGIGSGKTIILRSFIKSLHQKHAIIEVFYPAQASTQLLQMILLNTGVQPVHGDLDKLRKQLKGRLTKLHRARKRPILVIDEAQNLQRDALKEIFRMLELKYRGKRLIRVLLTGLPQLQDNISGLPKEKRHDRMAAYYLKNLPDNEVPAYIRHRLAVAGGSDSSIIPAKVVDAISCFSDGTPRVINIICDLLLTEGYFSNKRIITPSMLEDVLDNLPMNAIRESQPKSLSASANLSDRPRRAKSGLSEDAQQEKSEHPSRPSTRKSAPVVQHIKHRPFKSLSLTVLVFEKNARMRVHLENRLLKYGYNSVMIHNFQELFETLDHFRAGDFQIIVADTSFFYTSGGSEDSLGNRALERVRTAYSQTPIIMTSTLPLTTIRSKLLRMGISVLLKKPDVRRVDLSEVSSRLDDFFNELHCCLKNLHAQFNKFYQKIVKFDQ